jgi:hypothetical protein
MTTRRLLAALSNRDWEGFHRIITAQYAELPLAQIGD